MACWPVSGWDWCFPPRLHSEALPEAAADQLHQPDAGPQGSQINTQSHRGGIGRLWGGKGTKHTVPSARTQTDFIFAVPEEHGFVGDWAVYLCPIVVMRLTEPKQHMTAQAFLVMV